MYQDPGIKGIHTFPYLDEYAQEYWNGGNAKNGLKKLEPAYYQRK